MQLRNPVYFDWDNDFFVMDLYENPTRYYTIMRFILSGSFLGKTDFDLLQKLKNLVLRCPFYEVMMLCAIQYFEALDTLTLPKKLETGAIGWGFQPQGVYNKFVRRQLNLE